MHEGSRGDSESDNPVANLTLSGAYRVQFLNQVAGYWFPKGSLGTETKFYLIVPFIASRKPVILILLACIFARAWFGTRLFPQVGGVGKFLA
jgi:hypothetical protein